jgi:hypothetical protein
MQRSPACHPVQYDNNKWDKSGMPGNLHIIAKHQKDDFWFEEDIFVETCG